MPGRAYELNGFYSGRKGVGGKVLRKGDYLAGGKSMKEPVRSSCGEGKTGFHKRRSGRV